MMALDILVCPLCKGPLTYDRQQQTLSCQADRLAFPIRDGVPVMIEDEAKPIGDGTGEGASPAAKEPPVSPNGGTAKA
ncbi:MAG: Trm112 family protein [Lautropia sp.]|nr:Trm112 family protein [Lautropia sp.]